MCMTVTQVVHRYDIGGSFFLKVYFCYIRILSLLPQKIKIKISVKRSTTNKQYMLCRHWLLFCIFFFHRPILMSKTRHVCECRKRNGLTDNVFFLGRGGKEFDERDKVCRVIFFTSNRHQISIAQFMCVCDPFRGENAVEIVSLQ